MGLLGTHDEPGQRKSRASHAGGYDAAEGIELVAAADVDAEKLRRFGDAWDVPSDRRYDGHEAMLEAEDLDVVSVCTPTFLHHEHVIDAVHSSADPSVVWCEKPIASSVADAEAMIEACDGTDTELLVNHTFRFNDKIQVLHDLIAEERLIGDVRAVAAQFRMELMRNSTHLLDTLLYLLETRPDRVSGYITGENEAVDALEAAVDVVDAGGGGTVVMEDGTFTTIDCTVPREISSMCYQFTGTEGKLYINNDDGEWRYWRLESGDHVEEPLPGIDGAWTWEDDYREGFPNAAEHVVELLDGSEANASTGREATQSLEIITAMYVSHYTDSQVTLPLERPLRDVTITSW